MVPLVGIELELDQQAALLNKAAERVQKEQGEKRESDNNRGEHCDPQRDCVTGGRGGTSCLARD